MMSDLCTLLPWDTDFWGYPIARLCPTTLTEANLEDALNWCQSRSVRCLYFAACGTCPMTLAMVAQAGFQFVDVRVDLKCRVASASINDTADRITVRQATASDVEPLCHLARLAHRDTRFFKDLSFDPKKCEELYAAWVARDLSSHMVLTFDELELFHGVGGYVTCQQECDAVEGRIGLIAVDKRLQGKGFGRALLAAAFRHFTRNGIQSVSVITQGTNVPALRLYENMGFRTDSVRVWFHKWFN